MGRPDPGLMTLDAEIRARTATAQLVHFHVHDPADSMRSEHQDYWLDLCLTPRPANARICFRDRWSPNRFEQVGKLFLLPPGEKIQIRSDGGPSQTSMLCLLRPEAIREWFDGELDWTNQRLTAALDIPDTNIRGLMLRLSEELRHPGFASEAMAELVTAQLAIELSRYCTKVNTHSDGGLASWRLKLIDERLHEPGPAPSLSELAQLCGLSVRQLTRGFRISRDRSIGDHVASSRVEHAKRMLGSDQSVKAIAYSLGFASPSSFCYAFRSATGVTPKEYRQAGRFS